jgi:hypothetical protein
MIKVPPIPEQGKCLFDSIIDVSALLVENVQALEALPEDFIMVTLPLDKPEVTSYALSLVEDAPEKPVVYALVKGRSVTFLLPQGPLRVELTAA